MSDKSVNTKSVIYPIVNREGEVIGHARIVDDKLMYFYSAVLTEARYIKPAEPLEMKLYLVVSPEGECFGEAPLINRSYVLSNSNYSAMKKCRRLPVEPNYIPPFDPYFIGDQRKK